MSGPESHIARKRMRIENEDWGESSSSFSELIRTMLIKKIRTDIILRVQWKNGTEEIECHSFILFAHSSALTMLIDRWSGELDDNGRKVITLTGDNPHHFAIFIQMMSWDFDELTFTSYSPTIRATSLTPEVIVGVLSLAHKYMAFHLVRRAEHEILRYLIEGVPANIISLFKLLRCLPECDNGQVARKIYRTVENWFLSKAEYLFTSDAITQLSKSDLLAIVAKSALRCSENKIYNGCYTWALNQCGLMKLTGNGKNIRKVLGEIFDHIRFPLMSTFMLTEVVFPTNVLTTEESLQLMVYKFKKNSVSFQEKSLSFCTFTRIDINTLQIRRLDYHYVSNKLQDFSSPHGFVLKSHGVNISRPMNLTAIGFYTGPSNLQFHIHLKVGDGEWINREFGVVHAGKIASSKIAKAIIDPEIEIPANAAVTIKFTILGGPTYVCQEIVKQKTKEVSYWLNDTVFTTFESAPDIPNGLNQIPWIMFSLPGGF